MTWEQMQEEAKEQLDYCLKNALTIYKCYPSVFDALDSPIPKSVALLYAMHEMGLAKVNGKWVPRLWIRTNYPEYSLMNLTGQQGRDDEIKRFNVHPYHAYSNLWAAQMSFQENIKMVDKYLKNAGFISFDKLFIGDQVSLILYPRSVGCGTTRVLLKKSFEQRFARRPLIAISEFLKKTSTNTDSYDGNQDTEVVRLRILWCSLMPIRAHELGLDEPLSETSLKPAKERDERVVPLPPDFYERADYYFNQAKRLGPRCEQ